MKWMIEEYGFSIISLMVVSAFIEISQVLYRLLTNLTILHMEGLIG